MTIKQKLVEAAKTINGTVQLDSIFESVDLSPEVKARFQTVFETAVKSQAIALAESHINDIASKSDQMIEEAVEARVQEEIGDLTETLNMYLDHVAAGWLEENKEAVSNSIKVDMFESMMTGIKDLFVEHNVTIPDEAVDVVAELESEIAESRDELNAALQENANIKNQMLNIKREAVVESAIAGLTESQKEKVKSLVEGVAYGDKFEEKLTAIVEMTTTKTVTESKEDKQEPTQTQTTIVEGEVQTPNFQEETQIDESTKVDPVMASYLAALK